MPSEQNGPWALAVIGVLGMRYQPTRDKTRALPVPVPGPNSCPGDSSQAHALVARTLAAPESKTAAMLARVPGLHLHEKGCPPVDTSGHRDWTMMTPASAVISMLPLQARYAHLLDDLAGPTPRNVVSDRHAAHAPIEPSRRELCCAGLLLEITCIAGRADRAGRIRGQPPACSAMSSR